MQRCPTLMFRYGFPKLRAVKMTDEHTSICQFTEPMTVKMEHRLEAALVPKDDNSGDRTFCHESRSNQRFQSSDGYK